ncbi:MAG: DUF697 domain-containing protein [Desulfobacterales bacterium]|nr:DUF697 domain-containing protein [Desulfobacterales bacterium]
MEEHDARDETEAGLNDEVGKIIKKHVLGAAGVGLIPMPLLDMVALTGVQLNMLRRLANYYDVPFMEEKGKHLIASLLGAFVPVGAARPLASLIKAVPVVGQALGGLSMSITAGASTYAVGKVFERHFASGGTFPDFDPGKVKEYFAGYFEAGERVAEKAKKKAGKAAGKARKTAGKAAEKVKKRARKAKKAAGARSRKKTGADQDDDI